jgi:hypothetical protein
MRRIFLFIILGFMTEYLFAQDIIVKQNRDQIKSKIIEVSIDIIKYKDFDSQDGPIRNIKISDVLTIIYSNGKVETFNQGSIQTSVPDTKPTQRQPSEQKIQQKTATDAPVEKELPRRYYKGKYIMIGIGGGNSYSVFGVKAQARFGGNTGFGIHSGIGVFFSDDDPNSAVHLAGNVGIKFFPYKGLYLDLNFGPTSTVRHVVPEDSHLYYHTKALYGPSFLVGLDQVWGRQSGLGFGFNIALGIGYNINSSGGNGFTGGYYETSDISPAADLGFIIRF